MSYSETSPRWFMPVAIIALLWNIVGVAELYRNWPKWPLAGTAVAVFAGVGGCVGLLMKKRWASHLFVASIIGIVVQNIYPVFLSNYFSVAGPSTAILPAVVFVIAIALLLMSRWATTRALLR